MDNLTILLIRLISCILKGIANESLHQTETIADRVVKNNADRVVKNNTTTGVLTDSLCELDEQNEEAQLQTPSPKSNTTTGVLTDSISELHEKNKEAITDRVVENDTTMVVKNNTTKRVLTDSISDRVLKYKTPRKHGAQLIPQWFIGAKSLIKVK